MVIAAVVTAVIASAPVVFMVPVAFVHLPALLVVVIVRMTPVRTRIRRLIPAPRNPNIPPTLVAPVAFLPCVTLARRRRPTLIA
jgi:hypothetical protein